MVEIDIEQIMQEIREDIKEKGYKASDLSFADIPLNQELVLQGGDYDEQILMNVLQEANTRVQVDCYQPVGGGLKGFMKKVIRKIMSPIMVPVVGDQNQFNASTVQTLNQMHQCIIMQEQRIRELEAKLEEQ